MLLGILYTFTSFILNHFLYLFDKQAISNYGMIIALITMQIKQKEMEKRMFKSIKTLSMATLVLGLTTNVNAELIEIDWQNAGDNLITSDTVTGFNWLDLTETNSMSYNDVLSQLGSGGAFDGFRVATSDEVVALFSEIGTDLSNGAVTFAPGTLDAAIVYASDLLGNIINELGPSYPYGMLGLVADGSTSSNHYRMGSYYYAANSANYYEPAGGGGLVTNTDSNSYTGTYLVDDSGVSAVPVPAAAWLFGSGLLGLIGVARRKTV